MLKLQALPLYKVISSGKVYYAGRDREIDNFQQVFFKCNSFSVVCIFTFDNRLIKPLYGLTQHQENTSDRKLGQGILEQK